jgi:integrase
MTPSPARCSSASPRTRWTGAGPPGLTLPRLAVDALRALRDAQDGERLAAGQRWQGTGLVFTTHRGAALDAGNVRKTFKRVCAEAGTGEGWTPRELRTTFVSLMSHHGVSTEEIARLAGHASTRTTEVVYRRELRPVITTGAEIMDQIFTASQPCTSPKPPASPLEGARVSGTSGCSGPCRGRLQML